MKTKICSQSMCRELVGELCDMAEWLSGDGMTPEHFRRMVMDLEARKLIRFGLVLSGAVSARGMVHFSLRFADNDDLCASMDVNPKTGKLSVQYACV